MTGVAKKTVKRVLVEVGKVCEDYQDRTLHYSKWRLQRRSYFGSWRKRREKCQSSPLPTLRSTLPLPTKHSTAAATVPDSAAVLLRHSVVIDVHSERNGTNRLTVSFRSPRQWLPGVVLRFRCYNIYLDRVRIMRRYGINHRTWFFGPPRGQDRTQCDLSRSVGIVMN